MPEKDLVNRVNTEYNNQNKSKDNSNKFDDPDIYKNYIKGETFGEIGAAAGSYIGAKLGETYFKSSSRLLNILSGSIPGDYALGSLFSGAYFYYKYRDEYKGWSGKKTFLKDQVNFHIRESPAVAASYLAYAPITAAGLALGLAAGPAAVVASVLSSALYILGSFFLTKGYLKKLGRKRKKDLSPASSPAPQTT